MSNFNSKPLAKLLFNPRSKVNISIATVQSRTHEFSSKFQFLVLKNSSPELPTMSIIILSWNLPEVALADPQIHVPGRIDLIDSEAFWELHTGRKMSLGKDLPWLTEKPFGWAVAGTASIQSKCIPRICNLSTKDDPLETALLKFCEIETICRRKLLLPRTENPEVVLGSSQEIANRRLRCIERRLERDPATKDAYHRFMDEYLDLGHMKKLDEPVDDDIPHCYIPHHALFKESTAVDAVIYYFYVDDFFSGADDVESAIQLRQQVTTMLSAAGFPIKKWASNIPELLQDVTPENLALNPLHDLQDEQVV
ncbi:uncharacterized protein LOC135707818 [Ochlerotatus camptorhynchus]|uniref:uncharacterized protein LOC135707818 n=1 Tax=Ochlerotatus camptorhynchus TaxID=644619 RepID=UPI0031D51092